MKTFEFCIEGSMEVSDNFTLKDIERMIVVALYNEETELTLIDDSKSEVFKVIDYEKPIIRETFYCDDCEQTGEIESDGSRSCSIDCAYG